MPPRASGIDTDAAVLDLSALPRELRREFVKGLKPLGRRGRDALRRQAPVGSRRASVRSVARGSGRSRSFERRSVKPGALRRAITFKVEAKTAVVRIGIFGKTLAATNAYYRHFVIAGTARHSIRKSANASSRNQGIGRGGFVSARPNRFVSRFAARFEPVLRREIQRRFDAHIRRRNRAAG